MLYYMEEHGEGGFDAEVVLSYMVIAWTGSVAFGLLYGVSSRSL